MSKKVKIDPESREDIVQLIFASDYLHSILMDEPRDSYVPGGNSPLINGLQESFRHFKEGRIMEEPMGTGAVIFDIYGEVWVRAGSKNSKRPWLRVDSDGEDWSKFSSRHVVDVYSEGTTKA